MLTRDEMQARALALLQRKYVQRSDSRQVGMGLSYTEAETTDLAKTMVEFTVDVLAMVIVEKSNA